LVFLNFIVDGFGGKSIIAVCKFHELNYKIGIRGTWGLRLVGKASNTYNIRFKASVIVISAVITSTWEEPWRDCVFWRGVLEYTYVHE